MERCFGPLPGNAVIVITNAEQIDLSLDSSGYDGLGGILSAKGIVGMRM